MRFLEHLNPGEIYNMCHIRQYVCLRDINNRVDEPHPMRAYFMIVTVRLGYRISTLFHTIFMGQEKSEELGLLKKYLI